MARKPNSAKIGPFVVPIVYDASQLISDEDASGEWQGQAMRIVIQEDLSEDATRQIVLHEILHGCVAVAEEPDEPSEEAYVRIFSGGLLGVLRDNPKLTQWLLGH